MVGRIKNWENWCALAIAVITDKDAETALNDMGLRPARPKKYKQIKYSFGKPRNVEVLVYVFAKLCGMSYQQIADTIGLKAGTVSSVLRNYRKKVLGNDGRSKRQTEI